MVGWDDVRRIALGLPETSERSSRGLASWQVRDRPFAWERPLRRADLQALGDTAPMGPILGARVEHLIAKEALLADDPDVFFTTPHFGGYPAILVRLERIALADLDEVVVEAWLCRAPKRLARRYLETSIAGVASFVRGAPRAPAAAQRGGGERGLTAARGTKKIAPSGERRPMARKYVDCREVPSEMNCTVGIAADSEDELIEAAVQHAVAVHSHEDSQELRDMIRQGIKETEAAAV